MITSTVRGERRIGLSGRRTVTSAKIRCVERGCCNVV